jgi:hydrogenase expression/formation protein HypE
MISIARTLFGLTTRDRLILPTNALPGDALILTKRLAVEATSIIAREKARELITRHDLAYLHHCQRFLHNPGISVVADARVALKAGRIHAMHDPTEGGLATALHELAAASQVDLQIDPQLVPIYPETQRLCDFYQIDPWGVIASGSLLIAADMADVDAIVHALRTARIEAALIGHVIESSAQPVVRVRRGDELYSLRTFARDEIAKLFE